MTPSDVEGSLPEGQTMEVLVRSMRLEAHDIVSFELEHPSAALLPAVQAGAHIDVHLHGGLVRSYSLAGDPANRHRWILGVLREAKGRGGSKALHDRIRVGDLLKVGPARNAFALNHDARHSILIAGGIGITPIKAMAHELNSRSASFELHYCAKSRQHAAFIDELAALVPTGRLHLHLDGGDPTKGLNTDALLKHQGDGCHVYFCGPAGLMDACSKASAHWQQGTVHCEHFKAPKRGNESADLDGAFELHLARTGSTITVQPDQSIVRAIELAGHRIATSCLSGLCGACKVDYLDGEVDHRDYILSDEEKNHCLTTCVSRAKGKSLTLDL